jgi:hypothetical protein
LTEARLADWLRPPADCLPLPPAADRAAWGEGGRADRATVGCLVARAESDRGQPWPALPASAWAQFHRRGERQSYETACFARAARLNRAVVAAAASGGSAEWLDEVGDGLVLLCEQSSWCWPAHDDAWPRSGAILPDAARPYLDLGAGEAAAQAAWTWQLVGAELEARLPGLRRRLDLELERRVLDPLEGRRDWPWLGRDTPVHNWNPWILGHVLTAALRLVEDRPRRARLVRLCLEGLDRYVAALPEDGAVDEGQAYWWHGAGRLLEALAVLRHASGGRLDALGLPRLRRTLGFPAAMDLGGGWCLNYADASAKPTSEQPWATLFRLATLMGEPAAAAHALSRRVVGTPVAESEDGLARLLPALIDQAWARGRRDGAGGAGVDGDVPGGGAGTAVPSGGGAGAFVPGGVMGVAVRGAGVGGVVPGDGVGAAVPGGDGAGAAVPDSGIYPSGVGPAGEGRTLGGGGLERAWPRDLYYASTQVWVARQRAGATTDLTVSAKGGHNGENHNHCDVGTVIVALDGRPVLVDAGRATYTALSFGPERHRLWANASQWHNVPFVGRTEDDGGQGVGRAFAASGARSGWDEADSWFELELAEAYAVGRLAAWRRTVRLERGVAPAVRLVDGGASPDDAAGGSLGGMGGGVPLGGPAMETGQPLPQAVQPMIGRFGPGRPAAGRAQAVIHDAWRPGPEAGRLAAGAAQVVIHDAWRLSPGADSRVELRYLLAGRPLELGSTALRLASLAGATWELAWGEGPRARLVERPLDDPLLTRVWGDGLVQLRLDVSALSQARVIIRAVAAQKRT